MKTIYEMSAKELREIAKAKHMHGAWKATKPEMIGFLEGFGYEPETIEEPEAAEVEEVTAYEADHDETTETEDEEETVKTVKRPSLGINAIEFNGKAQTLRAWAEELEMPWPTLYDRINRNGWTIEEALTIPLGGRRKRNKKGEA